MASRSRAPKAWLIVVSVLWGAPSAAVGHGDGVGEAVIALGLEQLAQLAQHADRRRRVVEDGRSDLDRARPGGHELEGVSARAHTSDTDDGHRRDAALEHRLAHLPDGAHRDGPDAGPGEATRHPA